MYLPAGVYVYIIKLLALARQHTLVSQCSGESALCPRLPQIVTRKPLSQCPLPFSAKTAMQVSFQYIILAGEVADIPVLISFFFLFFFV